MEQRLTSAYARDIRPHLSREHFAPARTRLLWIPVHLSVLVCGALALSVVQLPWFLKPLLSLVMGCSFAGLTF